MHDHATQLINKRRAQSRANPGVRPSCCPCSFQWCHNERDGVTNHRRLDCLLNRLSRCWSASLVLWGESTGDRGLCGRWIPLTKAINAIWWRHHAMVFTTKKTLQPLPHSEMYTPINGTKICAANIDTNPVQHWHGTIARSYLLTIHHNGCPRFFLKLIVTCRLCVVYVRGDIDSNV